MFRHPQLNTHEHACTLSVIHMYMYASSVTYICTCMHPQSHTYAHSCTLNHIHAHVCILSHIHAYVCNLSHTHAHATTSFIYMHMYAYQQERTDKHDKGQRGPRNILLLSNSLSTVLSFECGFELVINAH